jgi:hypothetical protein
MIQFMKKCIVFILALAYLFAGSGILLKQHFCGGEFVAEELDFRDIAPPLVHEFCCQASDDSGSCCVTHIKLVKKVQEQKVADAQNWSPLEALFIEPDLHLAHQSPIYCSVVKGYLLPLQKPPPLAVPLYLSLCNWRI